MEGNANTDYVLEFIQALAVLPGSILSRLFVFFFLHIRKYAMG